MTITPTRLYASDKTLIKQHEAARLRHCISVAAGIFEQDAKSFIDEAARHFSLGNPGGGAGFTSMAREFEQFATEANDLLAKLDAVLDGPGGMLAFAAFDLHDLDDIIDALDDAAAEIDG